MSDSSQRPPRRHPRPPQRGARQRDPVALLEAIRQRQQAQALEPPPKRRPHPAPKPSAPQQVNRRRPSAPPPSAGREQPPQEVATKAAAHPSSPTSASAAPKIRHLIKASVVSLNTVVQQQRALPLEEEEQAPEWLSPTSSPTPLPERHPSDIGGYDHPVPFPADWSDGERAAPSHIACSALFSVVKRGQRRYFQRQLLASWSTLTITYTGEQLDQFDRDVWLQALELAREQGGLGSRIEFSAYSFLRAIGRSPRGKAHHQRLFESLTRLVACALQVSTDRYDYVGNLLDFYRDRDSQRYILSVNPRLVRLFQDGYTLLDWSTLHSFKRDLSRWLYGYVNTHRATSRAPHRVRVEELYYLCGCDASLKEWRRSLRSAMEELEQRRVVSLWKLTPDGHLSFVRG